MIIKTVRIVFLLGKLVNRSAARPADFTARTSEPIEMTKARHALYAGAGMPIARLAIGS
jgi:hypothetical protein